MIDYTLPVTLVFIAYLFLLSMKSHYDNFRGASFIFRSILGIITTLGSISLVVFLIALGYYFKWWSPIALFVLMYFLGGKLSGIISVFIPDYVLSFIGILVIPILFTISFVLMF